jgi:threonine 3-dehydrogenase
MKALVKKEAKEGLWLEDVPVPEIGINDVLIKVSKTSICGTDVHIYNWDEWAQKTIHPPMVIGHEFVGKIVEMGSSVHDFKIGDRVSAEGHVVCGHCRNCLAGRRHLCNAPRGIGVNRDGAFAEYISVPVTNTWYCDPSISDDVVSCFDPLGHAVHTALSFNGRSQVCGCNGYQSGSARTGQKNGGDSDLRCSKRDDCRCHEKAGYERRV